MEEIKKSRKKIGKNKLDDLFMEEDTPIVHNETKYQLPFTKTN